MLTAWGDGSTDPLRTQVSRVLTSAVRAGAAGERQIGGDPALYAAVATAVQAHDVDALVEQFRTLILQLAAKNR
jgi:hypothetical protein